MKHLKTNFKPARAFMTLLAIICSALAWADNVSEEQALQLAQSFVNHHKSTAAGPRRAPGTPQEVAPAGQISGLYVFNVVNDGGFVIVSNDDRTTPILGFSDSGSLDTENIPSNMRAWLQGYADEIAWLQTQSTQTVQLSAPLRTSNRVDVGPLLSTTWNQSAPYYNQTPYYKKNADGSIEYSKDYVSGYSHCVTGCVATAMAQVMNYHKWPESPKTNIDGYIWSSAGINLPALSSNITFQWSLMRNSYSSGDTDANANAVATLMKYCGWAVEMDYGPDSGAKTKKILKALKSYFGFKEETTQVALRSLYTYNNWVALIYNEIYQHRPVLFSGQSKGGGHEFVCDGYKFDFDNNTDYFHFNWGWGGLSDDYFVLSALKPNLQGAGGSLDLGDGFNSSVEAIIGIQKPEDEGTVAEIGKRDLGTELVLNSMTTDHSSINIGSSTNISLNIKNNSNEDYKGNIYVGRLIESSYYIFLEGDATIPAGETRDCTLSYTPEELGTYDIFFFYPTGYNDFGIDEHSFTSFTVVPVGAPTDLIVSDIRGKSAVLGWTNNNNANSWTVAYKAKGATSFTEVTAGSNPFTLTGLTPETEYTVKVAPTGTELWGEEVTFTTDEEFPAPKELAVGNITYNTAVATWTGYADSYDVRYGLISDDYVPIPATWLQYDNGAYESSMAYGLSEYTWGIMYPGNNITGNVLTKVSFFERKSYTNDITVNIYSGGDNAPGTLLYTQVVTPEARNTFREVTLNQPVAITPGQNLWITLTQGTTDQSKFPIHYCEISEPETNSQWLYYPNYGWFTAKDLFNDSSLSNRCWMIRGYIEFDVTISNNVTWIETKECSERSFNLTNLVPEREHVVQVRSKYDGGVSPWNTLTFTTLPLENINLTDNAVNNSTTLESYDGEMVNVTLTDRTLYKDGAWNTICLPFDVTLQGSPLEGAIAKTLTDATMTGTHVSLNFGEAVDELEAGIPYIIKWDNTEGTEENIVNPVFPSVTIASTEGQTITMANGDVKFIGYYDAFNINETNTDIYYMTVDNTLKHTAKARTLLACRAYFQFSEAATARKITLDFGDMTTEISNTEITEITEKVGDWYTLDGVKHGEQPTHKGIYIKDGKKVVIR